ncbi:uncharacterized protein CBL_11361 [Carabus blaptoides fortunei]
MEVKAGNLYTNFLVLCTSLCLASCLTLHNNNYTTRKPRITKHMTTTPEPGAAISSGGQATTTDAPVTPKSQPIYRVLTNKGTTCILMQTDALIEVRLKSNIGDEKMSGFIPENAMVEGDCRYEDTATMIISWPGYRLEMNFAKTPGGERWYVDKVSLIVSASTTAELHHYHRITSQGSTFKITMDANQFPTPVGNSFSCTEAVVEMSPDPDSVGIPGLTGTLYLREVQLQPFMYKSADFSPEYECNSQSSTRDETAPIAVGSTLALAVLCIITGYGGWRYFKVKKVQYNTME